MPGIHRAAIKHLSHRAGDVAVVFEILRQRHHLRHMPSQHILHFEWIEIHAGRVRGQSCKQADPGGRTQRHPAIARRKKGPLLGQ